MKTVIKVIQFKSSDMKNITHSLNMGLKDKSEREKLNPKEIELN